MLSFTTMEAQLSHFFLELVKGQHPSIELNVTVHKYLLNGVI